MRISSSQTCLFKSFKYIIDYCVQTLDDLSVAIFTVGSAERMYACA